MKNFFNPRLKKSVKLGKKRKTLIFYNPSKKRSLIFGIGTGVFTLSLIYIVYLYFPLGKSMVNYQLFRWSHGDELTQSQEDESLPRMPTPTLPPVPDSSFSVLIPKIDAKARVFSNIDPGRSEIYQEVLKEGVAHAAGTGFPGSGKTVYLFAHSTNAQWNMVRYNAVFFLINELENDDEVLIVYNNKLHAYEVVNKLVVDSGDISYLTDYLDGETLILQTCWPPGTILRRLLIFAKPKS